MTRIALALAALLFAGCAGFGGPRTVVLGERELAALLAAQFPREHRLLDLLDVAIRPPRLRLLPERNRLALELDVAATERVSGRTVSGSLALDHALRYEPLDGSVRLTQVRVERVNLEAGGVALPLTAQRIGGLLAERMLDDVVLWRTTPEQLAALHRAGVETGAVTVTSRGVEVTLAPRR